MPIWARWIRIKGADKQISGALDHPVTMGGQTIAAGDIVVLDADGAAAIARARAEEVLVAARERDGRERVKREKLRAGALSYDLDGLRAIVERSRA